MVAAQTPHLQPSAPARASDDTLTLDLWTKNLGREHGFEPLRVEGKLPANLRGTLYRNGPGQFGLFGRPYTHAFEADGAVTAVRIADGAATGASIVTATEGLQRERAAGEMIYGMNAPWRRKLNVARGRKNTANTSVTMWQDRLFALMEGGLPTELDPQTLAFIGETDLGGVVKGAFSAHPHRVAAHGCHYNFGLEYGPKTKLHVYKLPDAGGAERVATVPMPAPIMLHDFVVTETHAVFFVAPVRMSLANALLSIGDLTDVFKWKPQYGTEIVCVPLDGRSEIVRFTVETFFQWHFANAWTRSGGNGGRCGSGGGREIVVDYVRYPDAGTFKAIGAYARGVDDGALTAGRYHRATIDLATRSMRSEQISDLPCEFPTVAKRVAGREHEVAYAAFGELGGVGSIDAKGVVKVHELPASQRASEPVVVNGGGGGGDGEYLLSLCHERGRAFVAVYDAVKIVDGPVAKIWIEHHVPITFHGTWYGNAK